MESKARTIALKLHEALMAKNRRSKGGMIWEGSEEELQQIIAEVKHDVESKSSDNNPCPAPADPTPAEPTGDAKP